jgi:response regulator RpfG family c-di-GMP phosphodiesterase
MMSIFEESPFDGPAGEDDAPVVPPQSASVLIVDDEPQLRRAITAFLTRRGFDVESVPSALDALAHLRNRRFELMLCDVRMPDSSGLELLPRALEIDPELAVVMLSGVDDANTASAALQLGAAEYVVKPAPFAELEIVLLRALRERDAAIRRRRARRARKVELSLRTVELEAERRRVREMTIAMVDALINAMEAKDIYLRGRSQRVADLAASIADTLELDPDIVEDVRLAARLHDVGMIGIREAILHKPGALTPEEYDHVKDHVRIGVEILRPLRHLGPVLDYVHDHHERFDGTGYPRGLAGEAISIGGRILAAADALDALTSSRAYRGAVSNDEALETIRHVVGKLIDPKVYAALCTVVKRKAALVFVDPAAAG